jgi:hypothetical protein
MAVAAAVLFHLQDLLEDLVVALLVELLTLAALALQAKDF